MSLNRTGRGRGLGRRCNDEADVGEHGGLLSSYSQYTPADFSEKPITPLFLGL